MVGGSIRLWGCFSASETGNLIKLEGLMEKEYVKILKKQNKTKVQAVNRKNPPIIYYKPNKINVQSLDSRVFINVQKYCKENFFF